MQVTLVVSSGDSPDERKVTIVFDHPENLEDAIARWTEAPVFDCFLDRLDVKVMDKVRNKVLKSKNYDPKTAPGLSQDIADAFVLTTGRTAAVAMSTASFLAFLERKEKAGTLTKEEKALLDFAHPPKAPAKPTPKK